MTYKRFKHLFTSYILHPTAGVKVTFNKIFNHYYAKNELPKRQAAYDRELSDLMKFTSGDYEYWINRVERGYQSSPTGGGVSEADGGGVLKVVSASPTGGDEGVGAPPSPEPLRRCAPPPLKGEDMPVLPPKGGDILFSVIVPVYNVDHDLLTACIDSVRAQTYENWELILMDDCSTMEGLYELCVEAAKSDPRIKAFRQEKNGGISSATNAAIAKATGEFIALLDCDDTLAPFALMENFYVLSSPTGGGVSEADGGGVLESTSASPTGGDFPYDLIYSDEDKINEAGTKRYQPYFKPDYSPDSLLSYMYICHLSVYRKSVVEAVGGLRSQYDGSQDYDLALRVTEMVGPERIYHIPKILYHWRSREGSTATGIGAKSYAIERTMRVKEDALKRRGISGHAEISEGSEHSRVVYDVDGIDLVSVIIPSKDHPEVLRTCLESLRKYTAYKNYEIIVVDNGSNEENRREYESLVLSSPTGGGVSEADGGGVLESTSASPTSQYIYEPAPFNFSAMCNLGASHAHGKYLLFLNDDTEILETCPEWMERMLGCAKQKHVGAVGAKLLYGDRDSIQHCGVVNTRSGPGHMFCTFTDSEPHYFNKNKLDIDVIAVTAACLMLSREKFDLIKGFDESFAVAYNDMDFCFKLYEEGLYNVQRNDAILIHHESISRGSDFLDAAKIERLFSERSRLYERHPGLLNHDPFYNINLNQYAPDHEFNLDFDYDFYCAPLPLKGEDMPALLPKDGDKGDDIRFDITNIIVDWAIHIVGWVLFLPDNDLGDFEMLLIHKETGKAFRMATKRMYLKEVCRAYYKVPHSEFSGFRTMSDRHLLDVGEYDIYFYKDGLSYETGKTVKI